MRLLSHIRPILASFLLGRPLTFAYFPLFLWFLPRERLHFFLAIGGIGAPVAGFPRPPAYWPSASPRNGGREEFLIHLGIESPCPIIRGTVAATAARSVRARHDVSIRGKPHTSVRARRYNRLGKSRRPISGRAGKTGYWCPDSSNS